MIDRTPTGDTMTPHITHLVTGLFALSLFASAALADGTVGGKVTFRGKPPAREPPNVSVDPFCAKHAPPPVEDFVVAADGSLANVVVYVKDGLPEGKEYPAPTDPVLIDQVACRYTPHVVAVRVGQPLKVTNGDVTMHNVHGMPKSASEFNLVQGQKGAANTWTFKEAERGFVLKCDVHTWMRAYVWVVPHPYFAVSGTDGSVTLPKLPAGQYTIVAWHERAGTREQKIKVEDGKQTDISFTFEAKKN
jgi:plastocyanin